MHARNLAERARGLLRELEQFGRAPEWQPTAWSTTVTIAANDFQRDLLVTSARGKAA